METKQVIFRGATLVYRTVGEGKPVMLVHGFGESSDVWDQQVLHLQNKFKLIIPDLPGSGQSSLLPKITMETMADALKAIAEEEKLAPFTMIGHSMGGYITLAFAAKYQTSLHSFGLFHSSAFADSDEKIATRKKGIAFIQEHGAFAFLKNTAPNLFSPVTKKENPGLIDRFIAGLSNFSPEALVLYYEAMIARPDRTDLLKTTPLSVHFVMGEHDTAVPIADGLKLCHMPGISYIDILSQSGHMGMLEETDRTNRILEKFLTEV